MPNNEIIEIANARLSYPSLWKKAVFNKEESKFQATLIFPKNSPAAKAILKALAEMQPKGKKLKTSLRVITEEDVDMEDKNQASTVGWLSLKTSSTYRPAILDRRNNPVLESDELIYAGCYVNGLVSLWMQDNQFGKRINCNLHGIQFVKDAESFESRVDATKFFKPLEESEESEDDEGTDEGVPF